jgi:hypothetical protein
MTNLSMKNGKHDVAPIKPNMLQILFATLGKGQLNVKVNIEDGMYNYIIPVNCWYYY